MYTETDFNFTPHFERFDMLDEGVKFVRGFFQDSLPLLRERFVRENRKIAVLYADGVLWNVVGWGVLIHFPSHQAMFICCYALC